MYLDESIQSILTQSCHDFELIVIDGKSTDNSVEIIKKHESKLAFWVSEPDKGQSDAFNKGFSKAMGKYYFWLNADDILLPDSLQKAKDYFLSHFDCTWLIGNSVFFDKNSYILWCTKGVRFFKWLKNKSYVSVNGPTSFFKNTLFIESKGFDLSLHYTMDIDLWMKFIENGHYYQKLNHYCWGFRVHEESKTSHAFNNKANTNFTTEQELLCQRHKYEYKFWAIKFVILFKLVSGSFIQSYFDTLRFKGKKANYVFK